MKDIERTMQRMTWAAKVRAGTDPGEVTKKELVLVGLQRPLNKNILFAYAEKPVEFSGLASLRATYSHDNGRKSKH